MALPNVFQYIAAMTAKLTGWGLVVTGSTIGATSVAIFYTDGPGQSGFYTGTSGTNYFGVPGPEIGVGLPFLVAALAYGVFKRYRNGGKSTELK